ncbi:type 2 isopentenyl-diphosphate Delta-isomerase [Symbiobacterium terraclitae]|uniref:type 2 isopentenyl-diphosphate Delta-isomerase n=1 Tax=Symbiobacterium terraclitae TaxID=557451 RepID=UPI0035B501B8
MSERQRRKLDHVRLAVAGPGARAGGAGWEDVHLVHRSLPELATHEIDLRTSICGVPLARPVMINAMTGGAPGVTAINRDLAAAAAELELAMAVGSQTAGLREPEVVESYRVVRRVNPRGVILANLGSDATPEQARAAVEMVEADLLQLHLNAPQELRMREGDRDFRGRLERIARIVQELSVPVVVKECGFGVSRETARQLYEAGVRAIDVSGRGGTNFVWIEDRRAGVVEGDPGLEGWGLPAACALAEVAALDLSGLELIASGGIRHGTDAAKALALGARAVAVAGPVLARQQREGAAGVRAYLEGLLADLQTACLLCGARDLAALQRQPVVITGLVGEWCRLRGVDLAALANRSQP